MLPLSSFWQPGSLAHRTIFGIRSSNASTVQLLATWILGPSYYFWHLKQQCLHYPASGNLDPWPTLYYFWHLQQQCLHHPAPSILDPWPIVQFLASAAAMLLLSSSWHPGSLASRPVSGICTCNAYITSFWHSGFLPFVLFLSSAAAMLTSSSSLHSGSLAHRPV